MTSNEFVWETLSVVLSLVKLVGLVFEPGGEFVGGEPVTLEDAGFDLLPVVNDVEAIFGQVTKLAGEVPDFVFIVVVVVGQ